MDAMGAGPWMEEQFDLGGYGYDSDYGYGYGRGYGYDYVQVLLTRYLRGHPANSAIAATAIRTGDTTFAITEGGVITVSGGGHDAAAQRVPRVRRVIVLPP